MKIGDAEAIMNEDIKEKKKEKEEEDSSDSEISQSILKGSRDDLEQLRGNIRREVHTKINTIKQWYK